MGDGFSIQLTLLSQEFRVLPKDHHVQSDSKTTYTSQESITKMSTWPRGYKHPIKEWEFCPLQQGNPVHPSLAFSRASKPRPSLSLLTTTSQSLVMGRQRASSQSTTTTTTRKRMTGSHSEARISILSRSHVSTRTVVKSPEARILEEYEKNRPLPPLPLRIKKSSSSVSESLSFKRKRDNEKVRIEPRRKGSSLQRGPSYVSPKSIIPPPLSLPPATLKHGELEATTPGLGDAEVITIKLDEYPSPPPVPRQFQSFAPSFAIDPTLLDEKSTPPIPPHEFGFRLEDSGHGGLDIKEESANIPMKLQLDIPPTNPLRPISPSPSYISKISIDQNATPKVPQGDSPVRSVPVEEIVFTPGGYEERRYVYFPIPDPDLPQTYSKFKPADTADRTPPYYTKFPPPPHPEHTKKASTSSSRSQLTFSTFGHGTDYPYRCDGSSQVTDYDDYEVDEDDYEGNYIDTCASSFISASSYPASESSMGEAAGTCITPVPMRVEASPGVRIVSEVVQEEEEDGISPLTCTPPKLIGASPQDTAIGLATAGDKRTNESDFTISPIGMKVKYNLPPPTDMQKSARKSASTSRLSARLPVATPASKGLSRNKSNSCNNLKPSIPERPSSAEPIESSDGKKAEQIGSWNLLFPLNNRNSVARSLTPTPPMFRNNDGAGSGKLKVIEEDQRPNTAPASADNERSMSFFEDDDVDEVENGFTRVKKFLARCLSVRSITGRQGTKSVTRAASVAARRVWSEEKEKNERAKVNLNLGQVGEAVKRYKERKLEDMPVPPRAPSRAPSRMSRMSRTSSNGTSRWRWSYAVMGATFS